MSSAQSFQPAVTTTMAILDGTGSAARQLLPLLNAAGNTPQRGPHLHHMPRLDLLRQLASRCRLSLLFLHSEHSLATCQRLLTVLRNLLPDTPVVIVGRGLTEQNTQPLLADGACDYLPLEKLDHSLLLRTLRHVRQLSEQHRQLHQLRNSDPLTGIHNRTHFYRQLAAKLEQHDDSQPGMALLTIDIDGFTRLNHNLGPRGGDAVVMMLSKRLRQALRPGDLLARMGTDEFAILLQPQAGAELWPCAKQYAIELMNILTPPYRYRGHDSMAYCSIGIALVPKHGDNGDDIIRRASLARFSAKKKHGCSYALFDESQETHISNTPSTLEAELFTALRGNQFELYYQPRVEISTGRIIGAEALIRWQHPQKGLVMPDQFIPLAENTGLIVPIGYWAIHNAGQSLMQLRNDGLLQGRVGVNLSFRQFKDEQMAATITRIIEQQQIDTSALEFELTESALIKDERHVRSCIEQLSALGVAFSLDDFGTGYSSFALLQKLPIHTLKIDRSFVSHVHNNPDDAEIVRAIINLAHNLDKMVIAEGVETEEQLRFLRQHHCDQVQGYYFSRPIPFDDFRTLLQDNRRQLGVDPAALQFDI
ncbi:MAG: bifunctional diguanylate cyclase/phosphodiesterase [Marinobacterium sp.]|nr:bifunctional diguanylate cyclase/phosphodiesterase [Marinobacterium sp.]